MCFAIFSLQIAVQKYYFLRTYANIKEYFLYFLHKSSIFTQPNLRMCDFCSTFAPDFGKQMKRTILHSIALCLLMLCPLCANAQRWSEEQEFHEISGNELTYTDKNKTGITDFVRYTCSGSDDTKFGQSPISSKISILLPKAGSTVTTTKISDLVGLQIFHDPYAICKNVQVYISLDSTKWELVSVESTYKTGSIDIPTFMHDSYYVKITNTTASTFAIRSISYFMEKCNCFRYVE